MSSEGAIVATFAMAIVIAWAFLFDAPLAQKITNEPGRIVMAWIVAFFGWMVKARFGTWLANQRR